LERGEQLQNVLSAFSLKDNAYSSPLSKRGARGESTRIIVDHWDDTTIFGRSDYGEDVEVPLPEGYEYFLKLLKEGDLINVVADKILIYQPDYLVDISSVAACFESYADTPYVALLNRLKTTPPTRAIHLGNLASQFLDEVVHGKDVDYAESVTRFFHHNAIDMAAAEGIDASFHKDAREQLENIRIAIHETLEKEVGRFDASQVLLEPSFFCETLGLQGRMDLLQRDYRVLIEQKSGKGGFPSRDPDTPVYQEKHYVQMLLYMAMLHYGYERDGQPIRNSDIQSFLLYSKYKKGLVRLGVAPELLHKALMLRNQIAYCEMSYAKGGAEVLLRMKPEQLRRKEMSDRFWATWVRPEIERVLTPIQTATPLEQTYFLRMLRFVATEHVLSKMGHNNKEDSGFAAKWHSSLDEKLASGSIIDRLEIQELVKEESGVVALKLTQKTADEAGIASLNFRLGDIVTLYAYENNTTPDIRKTIVHRGTIDEMYNEESHLIINIRLRAPQSDEVVFVQRKNWSWAVEHDFYEASTTSLFRSLHQFLSAPAHRKSLILGQRSPEVDRGIELKGDYGEFNDLVRGAMQARDLYLVVGPPGTGKTSFGLLNILKEQLQQGGSILLMAYTNRAVDEICSKLVEEGLDFLRIGSPFSCEKPYREYLIENRTKCCKNIGEIRDLIDGCRVFVGTTTAITSASVSLFRLKSFDLAIIDEASQILEPQLLGLLSATKDANITSTPLFKEGDGGGSSIQRFVLIGDHKQLPAVVQQSEEDSKVTEQCLIDIGLTNCRNSLFERLYNGNVNVNGNVVYFLSKQGRMHAEIAEFPNNAFYEGKLGVVGLPHQLETIEGRRIEFIPVPKPDETESDKVNVNEARVIAREVVKAIKEAGENFDPLKTVGVIVPYRNQIAAVRQAINEELSCAPVGAQAQSGTTLTSHLLPLTSNLITIDTVERYQGSQRDVIIYGFTVQYQYQLKFLSSATFTDPVSGALIDRRLNVALTRAKKKEIIVGNPDILCHNEIFKNLIMRYAL
jgi:ABC-type cobalamin/Fe3+-siderophores transport system ATPase subunit